MRGGNKPQLPRCTLARLQSHIDAEAMKRDGWRAHGILVASLSDDRLDMIDRELVARIGNHLYGDHNG